MLLDTFTLRSSDNSVREDSKFYLVCSDIVTYDRFTKLYMQCVVKTKKYKN